MMTEKLPIIAFPTPILPGGRAVIQLTNAEDNALIKAYYQYGGIVLAMVHSTHNPAYGRILPVATYAQVIDFYVKNEITHVVFDGQHRIQITDIAYFDALRLGQVARLPDWPEEELQQQEQILAQKLQDIYSQFPELSRLYAHEHFDDASWLCQRWLEIIEMPVLEKYHLLSRPSAQDTKDFLIQNVLMA